MVSWGFDGDLASGKLSPNYGRYWKIRNPGKLMLHCWSTRLGFQMFKAPAKWIQMEVTTPLLPGHLLQVFVRQWQKERSWSPILTKHIDIATGAAKKK